ncbi:DUF4489 domain-containing protein [Alkaliphilus pronyensis]|uniref:DUF4489 domain-containing protein n=1 Tax=Alkaliphilus pronyensis TaxID=1482732 RepID=A0A6I0F3D8_9FIRM|nr:DUF4489 domain-containing protein [Alkaliphilus pronyensis]KAB3532939.1 DUF4489 domain-containing protein [Alkaliphilus pronyensis]
MKICFGEPLLNCGKIYKNSFSSKLIKNNLPINLASVQVNTRNIKNPYVLINYSQNLEFEFGGFNPVISIVYRLILRSNYTGDIKVLECWNYRASEVIPTTVQEFNTIEPLVVNFCDYLGDSCNNSFTYILQIAETVTQNTSFNISNQEMSAIVSSGR